MSTCPKHPQCLVWQRELVIAADTLSADCCAICGAPFSAEIREKLATVPREPPVIRTFENYRAHASKTDADHPLEYYALGLAGEAGECVDALKKFLYHQHGDARAKACEELGDLMWYVDRLAAHLGLTLEEVASANAAKLAKRYGEAWSAEKSRNREEGP